jgi:hypothetical protein
LEEKNVPEPRLIGQQHVFEEGDVDVVIQQNPFWMEGSKSSRKAMSM